MIFCLGSLIFRQSVRFKAKTKLKNSRKPHPLPLTKATLLFRSSAIFSILRQRERVSLLPLEGRGSFERIRLVPEVLYGFEL